MRQEESKMKRNTIFLSAIAGTLLLTACGGGSVGRQADNAIVADTDETENGMAGTEENTAAAEPGNSVLPGESADQTEENAAQADQSQKEGAEQEESDQDADAGQGEKSEKDETETDDTPKKAPQLPKTGRLRISCRTAGSFLTAWNWISTRTAFLIMWACCRR